LGAVLQDLQADLRTGKDVSGPELARKFVEQSHRQPMSNLHTATLSAVDLAKVDGVAQAVGQLQNTLMDQRVEPALIADIMKKAQRIEYSGIPRLVFLQDIGSFAAAVHQSVDNPQVRQAAEKVQEALKGSVIAEEHSHHSKESPTGWAVRAVLGKKLENLDGLSGMSIHYDSDVNARGNRLFQFKDSELARQIDSEKFLKYVSQASDAQRAKAPAWKLQLEQLTYKKRIFEYKLGKKLVVPGAVPILKRAAKMGAMIGASAVGEHLGLPMGKFWGAYFTYKGAEKVVQSCKRPADKFQLTDQLADATMGACLGTFGVSLMGALPHSVVLPAVAVAVGARVGRHLAKAAINQPYYEAFRRDSESFKT
jgi:hypothetical protein